MRFRIKAARIFKRLSKRIGHLILPIMFMFVIRGLVIIPKTWRFFHGGHIQLSNPIFDCINIAFSVLVLIALVVLFFVSVYGDD